MVAKRTRANLKQECPPRIETCRKSRSLTSTDSGNVAAGGT